MFRAISCWRSQILLCWPSTSPFSAGSVCSSINRKQTFVDGLLAARLESQAIWTAVQQPGIKAVAIKTEAQQAVLALHRMRQQLVKFRTAQINALRGL